MSCHSRSVVSYMFSRVGPPPALGCTPAPLPPALPCPHPCPPPPLQILPCLLPLQANAEQFRRLLRQHQETATELREAEVGEAKEGGGKRGDKGQEGKR